jgi:DNA-binding NtrC family response regulator
MPLKLLYLDDEPDLCESFSDEFSSDDILITTFTAPKDAVEAAKQLNRNFIFIDYRLPDTMAMRWYN